MNTTSPPCAFPDCEKLQSHGPYCASHYFALRGGRQPRPVRCIGCRKPLEAGRSQYCGAVCAKRNRRHGEIERGMNSSETMRSLEDTLAAESLPPWDRHPQPTSGPFLRGAP